MDKPRGLIADNDDLQVGMIISFLDKYSYTYDRSYLVNHILTLPEGEPIDIVVDKRGGRYRTTVYEEKALVEGGMVVVPRSIEVDYTLPTEEVTGRKFTITSRHDVEEVYYDDISTASWWWATSQDGKYRIHFSIGGGWITKVHEVGHHGMDEEVRRAYVDIQYNIDVLQAEIDRLKGEL